MKACFKYKHSYTLIYSIDNQAASTVIQITDPHLFATTKGRLLNIDTDASLQGVIRHIQTHRVDIDLLLATGDITQDGSKASYHRFLELTQKIDAPLRVLPGNHDNINHLHKVFGDNARVVTDLDNWRIVCLDSCILGSNSGELRDDQLALLTAAALQNPNKYILLALHHNPVPIDSLWLDTMMISNPEALFNLVATLPQVRAISWGHVHQEYDAIHPSPSHPQGVRLLATPSSCVQFTPHSDVFSLDSIDPGYRWFKLYPDGQLDTGVTRVQGLDLQPDASSGGY